MKRGRGFRVLRLSGAAAAWLVVMSCNATTRYVPDQRLTLASGALLHVDRKKAVFFGGSTALDIFTLDKECPDLSFRLKSQGYKGSAMIDGRGTTRILVPADQALLLRLSWTQITPWYTSHCDSAVIVRPDRGSEYAVRYISPAQGIDHCSIGLVELVENDEGQLEPAVVEDLVHLDLRRRWSATTPADVCAAARQAR